MKILIACDKFKGSLSAVQVCVAIEKGILTTYPTATCIQQPLADGGDGTLQILQNHFDYQEIIVDTIDPLNRKIKAKYLSDQNTAFIELAEASGITLLHKSELDVLNTNTIGTGLLMRHALESGHQQIILSLGGSCTNDAGLGIAYALGYQFFDENNKSIIPSGGNLSTIKTIKIPENLTPFQLTILSDVTNPLYGPNGAAHIYAPQKGANQDQVILLNHGLIKIAELIKTTFDKSIDEIIGGGAAGGIAAGLYGVMDEVVLQNGFDFISEKLNLKELIQQVDYVITGEGKFDQTSLNGKVVGELLKLCNEFKKPIIVVSGKQDLKAEILNTLPIYATDSIVNYAKETNDAMRNAEQYLTEIATNLKLV